LLKEAIVRENTSQSSRKFRIEKLEERIAPSITAVQINGGGNTPNGQANGVPVTNLNPAGHAPPGQNA
jgi:hypothetical protein